MVFNGYGKYRVHQVELEWTPEWQNAYEQVQKKYKHLTDSIKSGAERGKKNAERWFIACLVAALVAAWLELTWVAALAAVGCVFSLISWGHYHTLAIARDDTSESALTWSYAELALLRSLTHHSDEDFSEDLDEPSSLPDEFDWGKRLEFVRSRAEDQGAPVTEAPFAWLSPAERDTLRKLAYRRHYAGRDGRPWKPVESVPEGGA